MDRDNKIRILKVNYCVYVMIDDRAFCISQYIYIVVVSAHTNAQMHEPQTTANSDIFWFLSDCKYYNMASNARVWMKYAIWLRCWCARHSIGWVNDEMTAIFMAMPFIYKQFNWVIRAKDKHIFRILCSQTNWYTHYSVRLAQLRTHHNLIMQNQNPSD